MKTKREPKQFKTQQEVWAFLMEKEGNAVQSMAFSQQRAVHSLVNGFLIERSTGKGAFFSFEKPEKWQEHIEETWEDKLDGTVKNGAWCWYGDDGLKKGVKRHIGLIIDKEKNNGAYMVFNSPFYWMHVEKLTKKELEQMITQNEMC